MEELVRIPKDRVAVLIGKNGETKAVIEKATKTKLNIDSKSGEVEIEGKSEKALEYYIATQVVKAIARGFSPEHALKLLDENYYLDIIDIEDFVGKREKELLSKKGRLIGKQGKVREKIEEETGCLVSVYGKTVSIIGTPESMEIARKAVEMILKGSSIEYVFRGLNAGRERQEFEELGL
ncbi:MAG: RNA-processing protein [Candidatus Diapherotrites archaeon]|uniref:RNA-processing protein n=1 Tax=Candidatus Iainarchaeum sp. TaxID=3101447 RepID=A0A7J4JUJ2_9ARCH|nr:RNA-processing protein [Candidatus Diapherotrites archaeon]HIH21368.1 RNA-processing protein [Candidatus Diapherotrites archaeon]